MKTETLSPNVKPDQVQFILDNFRVYTASALAKKFNWPGQKGTAKIKNLKRSIEKKFKVSLKKRADLSSISAKDLKIPADIKL
jgi:hypothetical protein